MSINNTFLEVNFNISITSTNACFVVRFKELDKRFRGLDLIDKVPDELWTEVPDIIQEAVIKTIPKKKKCKKAKW